MLKACYWTVIPPGPRTQLPRRILGIIIGVTSSTLKFQPDGIFSEADVFLFVLFFFLCLFSLFAPISTHVRRFPSWKTKLYESPAFRLQSPMMQIAHALSCTVGGVYFKNSRSIRADADFITLHIEKKISLRKYLDACGKWSVLVIGMDAYAVEYAWWAERYLIGEGENWLVCEGTI